MVQQGKSDDSAQLRAIKLKGSRKRKHPSPELPPKMFDSETLVKKLWTSFSDYIDQENVIVVDNCEKLIDLFLEWRLSLNEDIRNRSSSEEQDVSDEQNVSDEEDKPNDSPASDAAGEEGEINEGLPLPDQQNEGANQHQALPPQEEENPNQDLLLIRREPDDSDEDSGIETTSSMDSYKNNASIVDSLRCLAQKIGVDVPYQLKYHDRELLKSEFIMFCEKIIKDDESYVDVAETLLEYFPGKFNAFDLLRCKPKLKRRNLFKRKK